MNKPRWKIDIEDANDPTMNAWHLVAAGRSRLRAVCVFLFCSFARPGDVHRLYWQSPSLD
jgi:hypothetical protein